MKQVARIARKGQGILCLVVFLSAVLVMVISGCNKEKGSGPTAAVSVGTCEVLDKLPGDIKKPLEINYGNKVKLLGVTAEKLSQNQLRMVYYWQPSDDPGSFNTVFVHFTDADSKQLFGNDHLFCQQKSFNELKGKFIKESYMFNIPESAVGKVVYVKIGLWAPGLKSGPRLQIESAGTTPTDDGNTRSIVEKVSL